MKPALAILAFALAACSSLPDPSTGRKNACLPEAVMMAEALKSKGITARVLFIETPKFSHAICTFLYEPGSNKLWGWDSVWKSLRLRAYTDDPEGQAKAWLRKVHPDKPLIKAEFL